MVRTFLTAVLLVVSTIAWGQYPARPIRLLVPNPPGGATDTLIRAEHAKYAQVVKAAGAKID